MRIIHCADLHLDSPMEGRLGIGRAEERKRELLLGFQTIAREAEKMDAAAVLIAGDLFDRAKVSSEAKDFVRHVMQSHPRIAFFYLKGNHDPEGFGGDAELKNCFEFGAEWTSYPLGDSVTVTGRELNSGGDFSVPALSPDRINLVLCHGAPVAGKTVSAPDTVPVGAFAGSGTDVLALGHIHSYSAGRIDARGVYIQPGCPMGRGFDECGEKGYVVLTIDEEKKTVSHSFVPLPGRRFLEVSVSVEPAASFTDAVEAAKEALKHSDVREEDLVRLVLSGNRRPDLELSPILLAEALAGSTYYLTAKDKTNPAFDPKDYENSESLTGEFVRLLKKRTDLTEEEKGEILELGLKALAGKKL